MKKQALNQKGNVENKDSKLSRAVKLAAAIAALGSTIGVDAGNISLTGWLSPAGVEAAQATVEAPRIKRAPVSMGKTENVALRNGQRALTGETQGRLRREGENMTLRNGRSVQIRGGKMFIIGADGRQRPAKDGAYALMDGRKINVLNGRAVIVQ